LWWVSELGWDYALGDAHSTLGCCSDEGAKYGQSWSERQPKSRCIRADASAECGPAWRLAPDGVWYGSCSSGGIGDDPAVDEVRVRQQWVEQLVLMHTLASTHGGRQYQEGSQHRDEELARQRAHEHERGKTP